MPTRPYTARELRRSKLAMLLAMDEADERARNRVRLGLSPLGDDFWEVLMLAVAAEPLMRTTRSRIGPERMSIARLELEAARVDGGRTVVVRDVYARFGVRLEDRGPAALR